MNQQDNNKIESSSKQANNNYENQKCLRQSKQRLIECDIIETEYIKGVDQINITPEDNLSKQQNNRVQTNAERIANQDLKQQHLGKSAGNLSLVCIDVLSEPQNFEIKYSIFTSTKQKNQQIIDQSDKRFVQVQLKTNNQQQKSNELSNQLQVPIIIDLNSSNKQTQQQFKVQYENFINQLQKKKQQFQQQQEYETKNVQKQEKESEIIDILETQFEQQKYSLKNDQLENQSNQQLNLKSQIHQIHHIQKENKQHTLDSNILMDQNLIKSYLGEIEEIKYDQIILQLTEKVKLLQIQYYQLLESKIQESKQKQLQNVPFQQKQANLQDRTHNKSQQILNQKFQLKNRIYDYAIFASKHEPISPQQLHINQSRQNEDNQQQQQTSMHVAKEKLQTKKAISYKFSSGDVENLLFQDTQSFNQINDLKVDPQTKSLQQLSEIPIVLSSNLYQLSSPQKIIHHFSILSICQSNLATIKESYQQLSENRIRNIMNLDTIVSKISFKEKHYPSNLSTEKQVKLYGKRLLRILGQISGWSQLNQKNTQTLNQFDYDVGQQYVVYSLKNNKKIIIICYLNHTIYIGEYITHGPNQQIIRQGFGIQIRQSKYIYQGQFFADKKHGYGFVQFIGKNPYIYCGYFLDGFIDGNGKSIRENGQIYMGDHKLGQRDGIGKLFYNTEKNIFYEGQFYDGRKHGNGYETFQNGDHYLGTYINDKFHGQGQYKWKNGTIYRGTFLEGYKHEKGLLILNTGKSFQKYYDHNKQINLQNHDDKNSIQSSSRISRISQSKIQQRHFTQDKVKSLRNYRSVSGKSLFSNKSQPKQKPNKVLNKKNVADILKSKQLHEDLRNLDDILKEPDENKRKKIFSVKKLDVKDKIIGKMYNTTQRPTMKLSEGRELDLFKLSKLGTQKKSLISFNTEDRLQQLKESNHRKSNPVTNFSQF